MFEKYKSGQTRIYNQICWARNYLVEAGYISKEKRGIWELTEKGRNTELTEKDLIPLFKSVQNGLKKAKDEIHYWWLNVNPKIWKIEDMKIGEKENYTTSFDTTYFERGDRASRFASYNTGIQNGIYSANEVRAMEDMAPREGGDVYLTPLNMVPSGDDSNTVKEQKEAKEEDEKNGTK